MTTAEKSRQYFYSAGKRKTAIARVKLFDNGQGKVTVNERSIEKYFTPLHVENVLAPLTLTGQKTRFDVKVEVEGGGPASQADAVRHGISRALLLINPEFRTELKRAGFLRRDSRIKERKKPGLHRARRAPQFSKR